MTLPQALRRWRAALAIVAVLIAGPAAARDIGLVENVTAVLETQRIDDRERELMVLRQTVSTVPPGERRPAIVLLHFLRGNAPDMADLTEVATLVRDHGITVLLPTADATGRWNYGLSSFAPVIDDVSYLDQVLDDAIARFPIDPKRIYMGGYSNGAQMTQRYICDRAGRIAAGAIIAGTIHQADRRRCRPGAPTPMLIIHGTDDGQVNYNGNLTFLSSVEGAQFWAANAGCALTGLDLGILDPTDDGSTVQLTRYDACSGGARVDHYTVNGGGHTWPGSLSFSNGLGRTTQDIAATPLMWQFFQAFSRP